MMGFNKHYIRVKDGIVTNGFSDAFESPVETDICINEKGGRHFAIDGVINPPMHDDKFCHLYRYDGELRKAAEDELAAELESMKPADPEPTTVFDLCKRLIDNGRTSGLQEKMDAYLANDRLTVGEYSELMGMLK